jgi:hypothetical protein
VFLLERGPGVIMKATLNFLVAIGAFLFIAVSAFAKHPRKPPGVIVKWNDLSAPVQATIQANAGAGKIKEVEKGTANGLIFYCAEVKGADGKWSKIYVKEAGDLIRAEPDNARNKRKHKPLFGD